MSILFTISSSWHNAHDLYEKCAFAKSGDAILLLQDAVLATHSELTLASFVAKCNASDVSVYVLEDDLLLRGIENKYTQIEKINYAAFVELLTKHDKQVAW